MAPPTNSNPSFFIYFYFQSVYILHDVTYTRMYTHTSHTKPTEKNCVFLLYLPFKHYEMSDCLPLSYLPMSHFAHTRFGVPRRFHCFAFKITYEMVEYNSEMGFCACGGRMRSPEFRIPNPCVRSIVCG